MSNPYWTAEWRIWYAMRNRCLNPKARNYQWYGGRGITIDPAWDSFDQFLLDMGPRPPDHTLDRKDNDGPYAKWNCRWATRPVQDANRSKVYQKRV
jgi:hypothetical protein